MSVGSSSTREREEEGEVLSEMAVLRNFFRETTEGKRVKIESKEGGVVLLVHEELRLVCFFSLLFTSRVAVRVQTGDSC